MDSTITYRRMCGKLDWLQELRPIPTNKNFYHHVCKYCFSFEEYCASPYYMHTCSGCLRDIGESGLISIWVPDKIELADAVLPHFSKNSGGILEIAPKVSDWHMHSQWWDRKTLDTDEKKILVYIVEKYKESTWYETDHSWHGM